MHEQDIFRKPVKWHRAGVGSGPARFPQSLPFLPILAIGVLVIGITVGLVGPRDGGSGTAQLSALPATPAPVAAVVTVSLTPTVPPVTPTPSCASGAVYLDAILLHEQQGRWEHAASTAELALRLPRLCQADKQALAAKTVSSGIEALFSQPVPPYLDVAAHKHLVARYFSLKRHAEVSGVPFPTNLQIATRAYRVGQFLLAKTAFEDAFTAGEFTPTDQALVQEYTATLYNLGWWWAQGSGQTKTDGLRLLVASHRVDVAYQVGLGAAWGELTRRLGADASTWPAPAETPLLRTR